MELRTRAGSIGLAPVINPENSDGLLIIEVEEYAPLADAKAEFTGSTLEPFDVTLLSFGEAFECGGDAVLDVSIECLKVPPSTWKEFYAAYHRPRRWRTSSKEMVSPCSARASSNSAAV